MMHVLQEVLGDFLIGIIAMAILAVCYLPVYFILRKKVALSRQVAYFLFIVCVVVILTATCLLDIVLSLQNGERLFATEHYLNLKPFQCWIGDWTMSVQKQYTQNVANMLMFVPLGFIFPVVFKKVRGFWRTTICMMLFSFLIEFVQYFIGRSADIDDLILNTVGGMLGFLVFCLFSKVFKNKKVWKRFTGSKK